MFSTQFKAKPKATLKKVFLRSIIASSVIGLSSFSLAAEPTHALMADKADKSMLLDLHIAGEAIIAVGERGHILVSNDQGQTWTQSAVPVIQMLTAVDFPSANIGFAVGHDGVVVSSRDGGKTWSLVRDGLKAQLKINEMAVKEYAAELSRINYLIEEGATQDPDQPLAYAGMTLDEELEEIEWLLENSKEKLNGDVIAQPLMDVWFKDDLTGFTSGAFGQLFKTSSGGRRWVNLSNSIGNVDSYHLNAVAGDNNGGVYVAGEAGFLTVSKDSGKTWKRADLGYEGSIFGLIASSDGATVIATGLRGNTFISKDQGSTWHSLDTGSDYSLSSGSLFGDQSLVLVGSGGNVAVSDDGGATFTLNVLPSRSSLSSAVVLSNGQLVLAGQGGIHHFSTNKN